jgi:hypothetical protein
MANNNRTINERAQAKQLRASMDAEQQRRREEEAAIARAHRNATGPDFGSTTEPHRMIQKPRIIKPGSAG